jgi:zinc-ribbon domain
MVSTRKVILASLAIACLLMIVIAPCAAQSQKKEQPTINEEYTVTVNDVGDAHVVDVLKYSADDFATMKKVVKENPSLLSRRYRDENNTGEVNNLKTSFNASDHSINIAFNTPGYCYDMKDFWVAYGFPDKPKSTGKKEVTFDSQSDINSEFTLFTTQAMHTKSVIELPDAARNVRWDEEATAIKYDMPPARSHLGFFSENKGWLTALFGLLALVFALLLVFVFTRKTSPAAAVHAPAETVAQPVTPPAAHSGLKHCTNCGEELPAGKKFCEHCGKPVG